MGFPAALVGGARIGGADDGSAGLEEEPGPGLTTIYCLMFILEGRALYYEKLENRMYLEPSTLVT